MIRNLVFTFAAVVIFSSQLFAQDLHRLNPRFTGGYSQSGRQARVNSIPTNFFDEQQPIQDVEVEPVAVSTAAQNLFILGSFAILLTSGGIITGVCLLKRSRQKSTRVAPPVKLVV